MKDVIWFVAAIVVAGCILQFRSASSETTQFKRQFIKNFDSVGQKSASKLVQIDLSQVD